MDRWGTQRVHTYASAGHTRAIDEFYTDTVDNTPPFITVILAKATNDTTIPLGMINDPRVPPSWTILSNPDGPFFSRTIVGSSTYGITGGSGSHRHATQMITTHTADAPQDGDDYLCSMDDNKCSYSAPVNHVHEVTVEYGGGMSRFHRPPPSLSPK